jgi:hypothetical protein
MTEFYVKFRYVDDTYYSGSFERYDLETLIKTFNAERFILLPNKKTVINLDHITAIDIEEVPKEKYR